MMIARQEQPKQYEDYLIQNNYAKATIQTYLRSVNYFVFWCERRDYDIETIDYKACLDYAKYLKNPHGTPTSKKTINHRIGSLKTYFNYLIEIEGRGDNPFQNMNIRGVSRSLNHNLLEYEELEDLFYSLPTRNIEFPKSPHVALRDKVITGLMVYQGLHPTSIKTLKLEHIELEKGRIYIPSTRKTNSRTLEIKSQQVLTLMQYLETSREALMEAMEIQTDHLIPLKDNRWVLAQQLNKKLRRINMKVKDGLQIRASVITYWFKHHNIREVQYMAGHRYISSTERYLQDDLENLQEVIESLHPIN